LLPAFGARHRTLTHSTSLGSKPQRPGKAGDTGTRIRYERLPANSISIAGSATPPPPLTGATRDLPIGLQFRLAEAEASIGFVHSGDRQSASGLSRWASGRTFLPHRLKSYQNRPQPG
jgi:hypothetical protein